MGDKGVIMGVNMGGKGLLWEIRGLLWEVRGYYGR